jgi:ATP-dependent Clp protease ATP-binding subunit ClpC
VGHEDGGQLTEAVRRKPFSVVLFDEVEKADPDVFNMLLQILEDGHLTDSKGRKVDFKNTVLIMTSNLGTADMGKAAVGFGHGSAAVDYDRIKKLTQAALKSHFKPEFLNRIDEVIVFHELTIEEVTEIVDIFIRRVESQLIELGVSIELTHDAKRFLAEKGFDKSLGARPLRRTVQQLLEDPVSEKLLKKEIVAGTTLVVDAKDGELKFVGVPTVLADTSSDELSVAGGDWGGEGAGEVGPTS